MVAWEFTKLRNLGDLGSPLTHMTQRRPTHSARFPDHSPPDAISSIE
jgi:hypothetical protein